VSFVTPAGQVVDLGCIFRLNVDAAQVARLSVETGWVELENAFGEVLVPAGASSEMSSSTAPLVPVFDDATAGFREAVRARERRTPAEPAGDVSTLVAQARAKDVLTLLMLARTSAPDIRRRLLDRAALLTPPPSTVDIDAIVNGNMDGLWQWYESLDLPPAKSWWLNWRDAISWRFP